VCNRKLKKGITIHIIQKSQMPIHVVQKKARQMNNNTCYTHKTLNRKMSVNAVKRKHEKRITIHVVQTKPKI
jgi:hypothetical protein